MKYNREIYWEGRIKMKKELFRRVGCIVLAVIMALSILGTNMQLTVRAEEPGEWKEVTVPDGDFESGETTNNSAWEFTGDIDGDNYFYKLYKNSYMKNNTTFVYQASSKKGTNITKEYKAAQTVTVPNGIYKASVDASGASEKGTHTTTLSAGGKSVAITPSVWDVWETYTTVGYQNKCQK